VQPSSDTLGDRNFHKLLTVTAPTLQVCFGFGKGLNPAEEDAHTATDQVPGGDFKYLCFGYSAFDPEAMKRAATARTNTTDPVQLPYCEGLEVVSAAAMSGKPELLTGGASVSGTSASSDPNIPGREGVRERPGRAFTGRPGVPEGMDWDKFRERYVWFVQRRVVRCTLIA
jgi:hypothetical protein